MKERISLSMMRVLGTLDDLRTRQEGQTLAEYALLLALIAVFCIGALGILGGAISSKLSSVATHL